MGEKLNDSSSRHSFDVGVVNCEILVVLSLRGALQTGCSVATAVCDDGVSFMIEIDRHASEKTINTSEYYRERAR